MPQHQEPSQHLWSGGQSLLSFLLGTPGACGNLRGSTYPPPPPHPLSQLSTHLRAGCPTVKITSIGPNHSLYSLSAVLLIISECYQQEGLDSVAYRAGGGERPFGPTGKEPGKTEGLKGAWFAPLVSSVTSWLSFCYCRYSALLSSRRMLWGLPGTDPSPSLL